MIHKSLTWLLSLFLAGSCTVSGEPVNIAKYLPENTKLDGTENLLPYIQKGVEENKELILSGNNSQNPCVYGILIPEDGKGLKIPEGHTLTGEKNTIIKRLPSKGVLIIAGNASRIKGITIDGNKKAHWPQFKDLGKVDFAIQLMSNCVVQDCLIYDNPGIAFGTRNDNNLIQRCKAVNSGYIDIKFNEKFYQGKWDQWSGDSFYIHGTNNIVMDCESEDAFRWDYTTGHENSGNTVYVNCKGRDVMWRTYGFIDIEGCSGNGSTIINCKSPDGSISISTSNSKIINCEAGSIDVYNADNVLVSNCKTNGGALAVGGWSSLRNSQIRGGKCPVIIDNVVNRSSPKGGITSDWSLSVFSDDEAGLAAGNVLNEYKGPLGCGIGEKFDKVIAYGNTLNYSEYTPKGKQLSEKNKEVINETQRRKLIDFSTKIPEIMKNLKPSAKIVATTFPENEAMFIKDPEGKGESQKWNIKLNRPEKLSPMPVGQHWETIIGKYNGTAWYFIDLPLDMDLQHNCKKVYLLFGGVDSACKVYVNGEFIWQSDIWNKPFILEIPFKSLVWKNKEQMNDIAVMVKGNGGIYNFIAAVMAND